MKILKRMKDGGPESKVWGYWVIEWKPVFSIVLLQFLNGSREAYHSHAFNAWSWVLRGRLIEKDVSSSYNRMYSPSLKPIFTPREMCHKVTSQGTTWVISLRGPWADTWLEYIPGHGFLTLTHGRQEIPGGTQPSDSD